MPSVRTVLSRYFTVNVSGCPTVKPPFKTYLDKTIISLADIVIAPRLVKYWHARCRQQCCLYLLVTFVFPLCVSILTTFKPFIKCQKVGIFESWLVKTLSSICIWEWRITPLVQYSIAVFTVPVPQVQCYKWVKTIIREIHLLALFTSKVFITIKKERNYGILDNSRYVWTF